MSQCTVTLNTKQLLTEVEVNSTWLITSELANQRARKVLFTCVVYTKLENSPKKARALIG